ncbi:MAG TPA: helix-turn-helix transcriptional regulator [Sporichthya sp.]|nr:helix-turn-helix transcriptional regulator [Sporichthya sp.]
MRSTPGVPLVERLRQLRAERKLPIYRIADTLGLNPKTVSSWEQQHTSPAIQHANAYAEAVGHHLVIAHRDNTPVADITQALLELRQLRRRRGLSQQTVGERMYVHQHTVSALEIRAARGNHVGLETLEPYLSALGYTITLAAGERAAAREQVSA